MSIDGTYPRLLLVVVLCCVVGGLMWGLSTSTVAFGPYNYDWNGGSDLRTDLDTDETTVDLALSTAEYDRTVPQETALVLTAPGEFAGTDRARLSSFVSQGGTLIVTSGGQDANDLLADLGVTARVDGRPVRDEQNNYRGPALVRASDVADDDLVRDVDAVTLNHGSVVTPGEARPLVNTSVLAYLDENGNQEVDDNETLQSYPVVAAEPLGAGTVVVVSDESVFVNAMLEQDGNRQLAHSLTAGNERVVLDYSQDDSLPPLTFLFLSVRQSPPLQFLLGVTGLALVAGRRWWPLPKLRATVREWRSGSPSVSTDITDEALGAYLADRHPDWEADRVERVSKAIIRQQRQHSDND